MANRLKTGGRVAGTPNKTTAKVRELLSDIISNELESLGETLAGLPPSERLQAVIKLMAFVIPKPLQKFEPEVVDEIEVTIDLGNRAKPVNALRQILDGHPPTG